MCVYAKCSDGSAYNSREEITPGIGFKIDSKMQGSALA